MHPSLHILGKKLKGEYMGVKIRKDSWTADDDNLLKEIVIKNMEQGKTQIVGFEEAGVLLGRTKQACAFRWNKYHRPFRLQIEKTINEQEVTTVFNSPSLQNHMQLAMESYEEMKQSYEQITKEYNLLKEDYEVLVNWVKQGISHIE